MGGVGGGGLVQTPHAAGQPAFMMVPYVVLVQYVVIVHG